MKRYLITGGAGFIGANFVKYLYEVEENPQVVQYLENLVGDVVEIKEIKDFTKAFEADIHKAGGKTIMVWNK